VLHYEQNAPSTDYLPGGQAEEHSSSMTNASGSLLEMADLWSGGSNKGSPEPLLEPPDRCSSTCCLLVDRTVPPSGTSAFCRSDRCFANVYRLPPFVCGTQFERRLLWHAATGL